MLKLVLNSLIQYFIYTRKSKVEQFYLKIPFYRQITNNYTSILSTIFFLTQYSNSLYLFSYTMFSIS